MATQYKQPEVTPEMVAAHGLNSEEHVRIKEILGREMTYTELGIFSVMWSEHCSYKNSIALLKTLPRDGDQLLAKAGEENAGAVDIGDGLAVVFKIESHNHPSAVGNKQVREGYPVFLIDETYQVLFQLNWVLFGREA